MAEKAIPVDARAELHAAIAILKTYHMNSESMDWPSIEAHASAMIADAKTVQDAYPAIRYLVQKTKEKHSNFIPADVWKVKTTGQQIGDGKPIDWTPPEGHLLAEGIGLISITTYKGPRTDDLSYARAARKAIQGLLDADARRFIVDLRGNRGGNMYPMINGVAALLGTEPYGYWQTKRKTSDEAWPEIRSLFESGSDALPSHSCAFLATAPVAVLIDRATASSGEFSAMAFEGRANTRVFGEPSAGYLTVNKPYPLPDGAALIVSQGWATDRLHREYRQRLIPDEHTGRGQPTLDAAIAWLKRQYAGDDKPGSGC